MHPYTTDTSEHVNVVLGLALVSVAIAWSFHWFTSSVGVPIPWWFEAPSILTSFGVLYGVFDRYLWCWPIWRQLRMVSVPNLAGRWTGCLKSSYDDYKTEHVIRVTIRQTWTHMLITLETGQSRSSSTVASVFLNEDAVPVLRYLFVNEPRSDATQTMQAHQGTTVLRLVDPSQMEGHYYTGRGRQNCGTLALERR